MEEWRYNYQLVWYTFADVTYEACHISSTEASLKL